jgi:hypothetical protein
LIGDRELPIAESVGTEDLFVVRLMVALKRIAKAKRVFPCLLAILDNSASETPMGVNKCIEEANLVRILISTKQPNDYNIARKNCLFAIREEKKHNSST